MPSGNGDRGDTRRRVYKLLNEGARLLRERRPAEAVDQLKLAWQLDPTMVEVAINLGGAYVMQGRHAEAVSVLEEASRVEPGNTMIWINLAAAYLGPLEDSSDEGQLMAIAAFEKALALDPKTPGVNYNLGLIYRQRDEMEKAAAHFWRALYPEPADDDARTRLRQIGYHDTRLPSGDD
ncbi:MAG: tetratricopeptide repeat protein [Anaerolineales bacterium]|nr:MAG: tetratricopeptide repeat protein [Anaerolineales bacterium]